MCIANILFSLEMYYRPSYIESLVSNFSVAGPASLELLPQEEPVTTATSVYDQYLGGLNFEEENADNITLVGMV